MRVRARPRVSMDVEQRQLKEATDAEDSAAPPAAPLRSTRKSDPTLASDRSATRSRFDPKRSSVPLFRGGVRNEGGSVTQRRLKPVMDFSFCEDERRGFAPPLG